MARTIEKMNQKKEVKDKDGNDVQREEYKETITNPHYNMITTETVKREIVVLEAKLAEANALLATMED